jgi:hypothetical protein
MYNFICHNALNGYLVKLILHFCFIIGDNHFAHADFFIFRTDEAHGQMVESINSGGRGASDRLMNPPNIFL